MNGEGDHDLDVTTTWKRRTRDAATGAAACLPAKSFRYRATPKA